MSGAHVINILLNCVGYFNYTEEVKDTDIKFKSEKVILASVLSLCPQGSARSKKVKCLVRST